MLAVHKSRHAQKLATGDDEAALAELTAIAKLELTLANIEQYERIRALTVRE